MKTNKNTLVFVLGAFGALAAAVFVSEMASANVKHWAQLTAPNTTSAAVEATNGAAFAWAVGHIDSSGLEAETNIVPGQTFGAYATEVTVTCLTGPGNTSPLTNNGSAAVACPFFASSIATANGFVSN
jgi:hypothetical protein